MRRSSSGKFVIIAGHDWSRADVADQDRGVHARHEMRAGELARVIGWASRTVRSGGGVGWALEVASVGNGGGRGGEQGRAALAKPVLGGADTHSHAFPGWPLLLPRH